MTFEDGLLTLSDGRQLAWRWWGEADGTPVLRMQGIPGSRLQLNPLSTAERELRVRYLMADRPGFGGSTRKAGRGIADVASDFAELLDAMGLSTVPVIGGSGGGPHALAFAACRPDYVSALTIFSGAAPPDVDDPIRGWNEIFAESTTLRDWLLSDEATPADAPEVMRTPAFQKMARENAIEALKQGVEGWTDEAAALEHPWDFDPHDVRASVTWWHGDADTIVPVSAAERVVDRMPKAALRIWHGEGHFGFLNHEKEILEELLGRANGSR